MQSLPYVYRDFISGVYLEHVGSTCPAIGTTPAFRNASLCNETTTWRFDTAATAVSIVSVCVGCARPFISLSGSTCFPSSELDEEALSSSCVSVLLLLCLHDRLFPCTISLSLFSLSFSLLRSPLHHPSLYYLPSLFSSSHFTALHLSPALLRLVYREFDNWENNSKQTNLRRDTREFSRIAVLSCATSVYFFMENANKRLFLYTSNV